VSLSDYFSSAGGIGLAVGSRLALPWFLRYWWAAI